MPEPRPLPSGPLHFVGIGGAGMSALAFVLASRGVKVSGSDPGISPATKARLESVGCEVLPGPHKAENVPDGIAALIVTDAVKGENPEVSEGERRGLPLFKRPEALGSIVNSAKTAICIAGTHGKTTTTGMVASILLHAGLNPTVLIGGDLPQIGGNAHSGDPDLVVAEACEAYGGLDWLKPSIAVILNMEADHLDFHGSEENFKAAFRRFADGSGFLIACADDEGAKDIHSNYRSGDGQSRLYSYSGGAGEKVFGAGFLETVSLKVPGDHNVRNAMAAALVSEKVLVHPEAIVAGLESFTGTGRRFELMGETKNGVVVIDDYAHHPTEIRATLQGARQAYPNGRLVAVFQPHLPSRTQDFLTQFAEALVYGGADSVYLTEIYLAREQPRPGLIELLAEKVPGATLVSDRSALPARLHSELRAGDVAIFMGAGNIREQAEEFLTLGS